MARNVVNTVAGVGVSEVYVYATLSANGAQCQGVTNLVQTTPGSAITSHLALGMCFNLFQHVSIEVMCN